MRTIISDWVANIPQSGIRVVYHEALKYTDVIHLEIGDPDFNTPKHIIDAAYKALNEGYTHYTHNAGLLELRQAITDYYRSMYGVNFDPERNVMITLGSTEALFLTLLALLNPGDEVLIPDPGYPSYIPMVKAARGDAKRYRLYEHEGFIINVDEVISKMSKKTKVIIINNPHNPTGSLTPLNRLKELTKVALDNNVVIVSDEVYERIVFDGIKFHSLCELSYDNIVVVNSLSKTYAMTGWRIGFVLSKNEELIRTLVRLQEGVAACAPAAFQRAAIDALKGPQDVVEYMVKEYQRRRDAVLSILSNVEGITFVKPQATFYLFLNVSRYVRDSMKFAIKLLREEHVAVAPGIAFGPSGEGYIRISFATSLDKLIKGVNKIVNYLRRLRR